MQETGAGVRVFKDWAVFSKRLISGRYFLDSVQGLDRSGLGAGWPAGQFRFLSWNYRRV